MGVRALGERLRGRLAGARPAGPRAADGADAPAADRPGETPASAAPTGSGAAVPGADGGTGRGAGTNGTPGLRGVIGRAGAPLVQRLAPIVGPPLRDAVRRRVLTELAPRRVLHAELDHAATDARTATRAVAERLEATIARLDRSPFTDATTVHAAHARHPGVQAIFARHGLPRCPDCAVGADETLAEAAYGEDLPLVGLLDELNALLEVFR